ncbi:MAG TPA: 50S ribosomal protein L25 [Candidatus Limnocylindrales bacterium]
MTSAHPTLAATGRDVTGKQVASLRRAGRLPAVVFGHGSPSVNVSVDAHEFDQLRKHIGPTTLIDLKVDGGRARKALVHSVQYHPVTRRPLHADLFLVRMTEELTVDVQIHLVGESEAVARKGGTLLHALDTVKVRALPDHLPQALEVSVESLVDFERTLHVRDLPIPTGVTLLTDPDEVVAKVLPPRLEEEVPTVAEAAEAAEAAEGAGGAGESAEGGAEPEARQPEG